MKQGHSVFHGCLHRRMDMCVVSRRGLFSATEAKLGGGHNCSPESFGNHGICLSYVCCHGHKKADVKAGKCAL